MAAKTPAQRRQLVVARAKFQVVGSQGNISSVLHYINTIRKEDPDTSPGVDKSLLDIANSLEELLVALDHAQTVIDRANVQLRLINFNKRKISRSSQTNEEGG